MIAFDTSDPTDPRNLLGDPEPRRSLVERIEPGTPRPRCTEAERKAALAPWLELIEAIYPRKS